MNDESTDPLDSVTESFTPSSRPNEHTHTHFPKKLAAYNDSTEVEPAYLQPKIIDALGIQPPEQVLHCLPPGNYSLHLTPYTLHPKIIDALGIQPHDQMNARYLASGRHPDNLTLNAQLAP